VSVLSTIGTSLLGGLALGSAFMSFLGYKVAGEMVSDEVRGWLDIAPRAILRLAGARLNREQRDRLYFEEWLPELRFIMQGTETRPITRAIRAIGFALGILLAARAISRFRPPTPPPAVADGGRPVAPSATADRGVDVYVEIDGVKHLLQTKFVFDHNEQSARDLARRFVEQNLHKPPTSGD